MRAALHRDGHRLRDPTDPPPGRPAPTGADEDLQGLADGCAQGLVASCDLLQPAGFADPELSSYGDHGATCGGRNERVESCVERYPG